MAANARNQFMQRFGGILFGNDKIAIIHLLQGHGLLAQRKDCPVCGRQMFLERYNQSQDGYRW